MTVTGARRSERDSASAQSCERRLEYSENACFLLQPIFSASGGASTRRSRNLGRAVELDPLSLPFSGESSPCRLFRPSATSRRHSAQGKEILKSASYGLDG